MASVRHSEIIMHLRLYVILWNTKCMMLGLSFAVVSYDEFSPIFTSELCSYTVYLIIHLTRPPITWKSSYGGYHFLTAFCRSTAGSNCIDRKGSGPCMACDVSRHCDVLNDNSLRGIPYGSTTEAGQYGCIYTISGHLWPILLKKFSPSLTKPPLKFNGGLAKLWTEFLREISQSTTGPCKLYPHLILQSPDSKIHGANMGPTWVLSAPDGPHVGPMNLAIRAVTWEQHEQKGCEPGVFCKRQVPSIRAVKLDSDNLRHIDT